MTGRGAESSEVRYTRNERVLWRRTVGAVLLMSPMQSRVLTLYGAGGALWDALGQPRTVLDAARVLAQHYRVPVDVVVKDIAPIVEELVSGQILRRIEPQ